MPKLFRFFVTFPVLLALAISLSAQTSTKPATGVISGRVTTGDKPLAGIAVVAVDARDNSSNAAAKAKALTDAEGRYKLTNLPPGSYTISPRAPVHVVQEAPSPYGLGRSVVLSEGETVELVDFTLVKGGVITGRVLDHEGKPAVGQRVWLMQINPQGRASNVYLRDGRVQETDDRGIYRLYNLSAGRYKLYVGTVADGSSLCLGCGKNYIRRTYYPNKTNVDEAELVEVTPGFETTGIDITLAGHLKAFDVLARVVDAETGRPVPNASCGFGNLSSDSKRLGGYGTGLLSDAQGNVQFQALLPGRYGAFVAEAPGYYSEVTIFEVTDSDVSGVEIKVRRGVNLSGQVVLLGNADDAVRARLRQTAFNVNLETFDLTAPLNQTFTPGADGAFTLTGLPAGKLRFALDYSSRDSSFAVLGVEHEGVFSKQGLTIKQGEPPTGVRLLVLAAGRGVLRGNVAVLNGALPNGTRLRVGLIPKNLPGLTSPMLPTLLNAFADERGRFVFEQVTPGEYELTVAAEPNFRTNQPAPKLPSVRQPVTVNEGETQVTLKLDLASSNGTQKEDKQ